MRQPGDLLHLSSLSFPNSLDPPRPTPPNPPTPTGGSQGAAINCKAYFKRTQYKQLKLRDNVYFFLILSLYSYSLIAELRTTPLILLSLEVQER